MKTNRIFVLPVMILIAAFNCIHGKNPNMDYTAMMPDAIKIKFQNIKENAAETKNKILVILKCISDSDLDKKPFAESIKNYKILNPENSYKVQSINIVLNDVNELKKSCG